MEAILISFVFSLVAGLATGIGAFPILLSDRLIKRFHFFLMAFSGGVMLSATIFSLILPSIKATVMQGYSEIAAVLIMIVGSLLGWMFLWIVHLYCSHNLFFKEDRNSNYYSWQQIWLFILAITLHNFPEGLVVGVAVSSEKISGDVALATGIGLQNVPEGLAIALSLKTLNYSAAYAIGVSFLTGLVEPIGSVIGAIFIKLTEYLLPWGMAFAAGAMLFVLVNEIFPKIDRKSTAYESFLGLMMGFIMMAWLDIVFS